MVSLIGSFSFSFPSGRVSSNLTSYFNSAISKAWEGRPEKAYDQELSEEPAKWSAGRHESKYSGTAFSNVFLDAGASGCSSLCPCYLGKASSELRCPHCPLPINKCSGISHGKKPVCFSLILASPPTWPWNGLFCLAH